MAGYGEIFRTYKGFCKGCFLTPLGVLYSSEAELMKVICAIEFANQYNDSIYVVNLLSSKSIMVLWRFLACWNCAINFLNIITNYVSHIFREGNHVADKLATQAVKMTQSRW